MCCCGWVIAQRLLLSGCGLVVGPGMPASKCCNPSGLVGVARHGGLTAQSYLYLWMHSRTHICSWGGGGTGMWHLVLSNLGEAASFAGSCISRGFTGGFVIMRPPQCSAAVQCSVWWGMCTCAAQSLVRQSCKAGPLLLDTCSVPASCLAITRLLSLMPGPAAGCGSVPGTCPNHGCWHAWVDLGWTGPCVCLMAQVPNYSWLCRPERALRSQVPCGCGYCCYHHDSHCCRGWGRVTVGHRLSWCSASHFVPCLLVLLMPTTATR